MARRIIFIVIAMPVYAVAMVTTALVMFGALAADDWIGFWEDMADMVAQPEYWLYALIFGMIFAATQVIFLLPVMRFRRGRNQKGKSLLASAAMIGLIAGGLTIGFLFGLAELFGPWENERDLLDTPWVGFLFLAGMATWPAWSVIIFICARSRQQPESFLGRFALWLTAGTIIEALIILPIDVMVRRRTDCYCATGTFVALLFAVVGVLWLSGPGLLIALTAKRRRPWYDANCSECGYAKGPNPGARCPECGRGWEQITSANEKGD